MKKLPPQDIETRLEAFPEWALNGEAIQRTFAFDDFLGAMSFVNRVAELAETHGHHPDIMIRYNKVTLTISTHDAGGLTEKDFVLARVVDGCVVVTLKSTAHPSAEVKFPISPFRHLSGLYCIFDFDFHFDFDFQFDRQKRRRGPASGSGGKGELEVEVEGG